MEEIIDLYLFKSLLDNLPHSIKVFILLVSLTNLLIQINCTKPKSFIKKTPLEAKIPTAKYNN